MNFPDGRAEQLEDYYKSTGEKVALEPIGMMKTIVENIQMCDMESFDCNLAAFRNYEKQKKSEKYHMEDTAYHFQYRSYHMSHNHWNPKISAEKAAGVLRSLIGK